MWIFQLNAIGNTIGRTTTMYAHSQGSDAASHSACWARRQTREQTDQDTLGMPQPAWNTIQDSTPLLMIQGDKYAPSSSRD